MIGLQSTESTNRQYASQIATLKSEYLLCQRILETNEAKAALRRKKITQINSLKTETAERLSIIQEEIDGDPTPEASQPLARLQKRDLLQHVRKCVI